jgi:hypothetical protein
MALMLAAWGGTAAAAAPAPEMAPHVQESSTARRLLRDVRMDARQIRAHAWQWAILAKSHTANWYDFDRQWNEIKPSVEDMSMKLVQLEDMSPNLPVWEQKAIDSTKPLFSDISSETHSLRLELAGYYNDLSNPLTPVPNSEARELARDAGRLVRVAGPSPVSTAS